MILPSRSEPPRQVGLERCQVLLQRVDERGACRVVVAGFTHVLKRGEHGCMLLVKLLVAVASAS